MKLLMRQRNLNQCISTSSSFSAFGLLNSSYLHHIGRPSAVDENSATSTDTRRTFSTHDGSIISHPSTIKHAPPPLSLLPFNTLIRSLLINSISASSFLLRPSLRLMSYMAHSSSLFLNPDRNPLLSYLLKKTFYAQFCAGETSVEVRQTLQGLRNMGYAGVCLCYAREVVCGQKELKSVGTAVEEGLSTAASTEKEIEEWKLGTLKTVQMTDSEDFVAVKFTGAGSLALQHLLHKRAPSSSLLAAITEICDAAASQGVRLLFDAEHHAVQAGIDAWTITFQRQYNRKRAVVYGTYQAYLKTCPSVLAEHLVIAQREDFTLGIKLVRGAYLASDPRNLIWDTKEETDSAYDALAECLLTRKYNSLMPIEVSTAFPEVSVNIASHNHTSVRKAQALRTKQIRSGEPTVDTVYAQLMGMADEVSCELLQAGREAASLDSGSRSKERTRDVDVPKAYKYLVWGSTGECMKYLLRRAEENRDAVERTREGRDALMGELWRRLKLQLRFGI